MKKLITLFSIAILFSNCNTNPNYTKNLATAQKLFELHGQEDIEGQLALVSKDIESNTSMYGSEPVGYDQYVGMLKGYHAAFDNIKYTADNWLPGTGEDGALDGSVRTYGTWTGTNVSTGKELNLKGYWYMNFDDEGKIVAQGDFFDFGGMVDAVYPKNLVFVEVEVKKGKKRNAERKFFPGYVLAKMTMNDATYHLVKDLPKVSGFLGQTKGQPSPVSESEINKILQDIEEGVSKPKPSVTFEVGEQVRVSDGPFASFNGLIEEIDEERSRVKVSVSIFGRSTPVELEYTQVEKA